MKILKKEEIKNQIKYTVASDTKLWSQAQTNSYKALAKNLKIPGFRAGHVPAQVAEKHISEGDVMNHALKKVVDENYKLLITNNKEFNPDQLIEDAVSIDLAKIDPKNLEIVYIFEKFPEVTLGDYKKIKIHYTEPKVEDKEVQQEIERYTKKDIMLIPKESNDIAMGDMVNFDFKGFVDDKAFAGGEAQGHELEIGSGSFIPGFEEKMIGLKKGDKKTIEVTFPKDYHAKDLANKKAKFELVINDIKTIQKPKLDEAYIARFAIPNVKTEHEFREYVSKQLLDYKKYTSRQEPVRQISEWIIENTKLSYLPDSLLQAEIRRLNNDIQTKADQAKMSIKDYIDKQLGYKNQKDFDKVLNESSQKNLHLVIGIEKIIEELKIDITDKELDEHFTKMAKLYGTNVNDIKQRLQNNFEGVKTFLLQEKTFDKLIELNRNNK